MRNPGYTILACLIAAMISACTTTGGFTTKPGEIDYTVTLTRVCTGLKGMDAIVNGAVQGGLIDARGAAIDVAARKFLDNYCDPNKPPTDLAGAIAAIAGSMVDMGNLIATIKQ